MPKVSVIIPTYNNAKYICEAIDSVLAQTYTDYEIIVVDDGSTDNTKEILTKYNGKIRYFYQENQGVSEARNKGIREAKGELIAFLDSDDVILNDGITRRVELFNRYPYLGIVFTDYYLEDTPNGKNMITHLEKNNFLERFSRSLIKVDNNYYIANGDFFYLSVKNGMYIWTSTVMIKKSIIGKAGNFATDLRISQDTDLWYRIIKLFNPGYVNIPLSIYKRYRGGLCSKIKERTILEPIIRLKRLYIRVGGNKKLKRVIRKKISTLYYDLGEHYIFNHRRTLAIKAYIFGIKAYFLNFNNWAGLFKACFLTMKIRAFLREKVKQWLKSVL